MLTMLSVLVLAGCGTKQPPGKQVQEFSYTDHHGQPFGTKNLEGKIWIASFVFANCETVCPPMMIEMATLKDKVEEADLELEFVSFSVDPKEDTSEVLKDYLAQFIEDDSHWHMLTGYSQNTIETFAREQFQTIVQKPETSSQVIHGTNFYLIDQSGYIVGEYSYIDVTYEDEILQKVNTLQKKKL